MTFDDLITKITESSTGVIAGSYVLARYLTEHGRDSFTPNDIDVWFDTKDFPGPIIVDRKTLEIKIPDEITLHGELFHRNATYPGLKNKVLIYKNIPSKDQIPINLIYVTDFSPEKILDSFDLDVLRMGISFNKTKTMTVDIVTDEAFRAIEDKRVKVQRKLKGWGPDHNPRRLVKYKERLPGYVFYKEL